MIPQRILDSLRLIGHFFPPDLSLHYLASLREPVLQTLAMAVAAIFLAILIAAPLSIAIGTRMPGYRVIYSLLAMVRAIPDLTLAIFCVVVVGLGTGAGLVALAIYSGAALAKVGGELFLSADAAPLEALRATGASRLSLAAFGLLPLKLSDTLSYGLYEFECAVRASLIVGAVGAGGMGTELIGSLNALEFHRVTTLILVLLALMAAVDRVCWFIRRYPQAVVLFAPLGLLALNFCRPRFFAPSHAFHTFASMLPPRLSGHEIRALPLLIFQTVGIAAAATLIGVMVALPASLAASRTIAPAGIAVCARRAFDALRAIPELIWGLLLVAIAGVGPWAGVAALSLHSVGVLGKLFAENLENVPVNPLRALEATGASRAAVALFGNVPLAAGPMAVHAFFRFEWNVRAATVLGIIGAGGIGEALYDAQQLFFYREMLAYILVTVVMVGVLDFFSTALRTRWRVVWEAVE